MAILGKILKKEEKEKSLKPEGQKPAIAEIGGYGVLLTHRLTEKSSNLAAENKFVFLVQKSANKPQVKKSVESKFGVKVQDVHIVNLPAKERRRGNQIGWKPGVKKAVVKIQEGQTIEIK